MTSGLLHLAGIKGDPKKILWGSLIPTLAGIKAVFGPKPFYSFLSIYPMHFSFKFTTLSILESNAKKKHFSL